MKKSKEAPGGFFSTPPQVSWRISLYGALTMQCKAHMLPFMCLLQETVLSPVSALVKQGQS